MKFAILTMENVRTMVTVHDEALRDVKFKPAEDARIQVVQVTCFTSTSFVALLGRGTNTHARMQVGQTLIMLGFVDAAMEVSEWLVDKKDAAGCLLY